MIQYPSDIEPSRNQMFISCHWGVEAKWVKFYEKQKLGIPVCAGAVEELDTPYHNMSYHSTCYRYFFYVCESRC
jgi:hypothetical protein